MAARETMGGVIGRLRGMCEAGTVDWTLGTVTFWGDEQLQEILDTHRVDYWRELLVRQESYQAGTLVWLDYFMGVSDLEAGVSIEDGAGSAVGTASYTVDLVRGAVRFGANTGGSSLYWSGAGYDMNLAAADVWRRKASHFAKEFTFSTDNHRVEAGSVYEHCVEMARVFDDRAVQGGSGARVVTLRS